MCVDIAKVRVRGKIYSRSSRHEEINENKPSGEYVERSKCEGILNKLNGVDVLCEGIC